MLEERTQPLTPLIRRLRHHSDLGEAEVGALEGLPHHVQRLARGRHLVREGERPGDCFVVLGGFVYRSKVTNDGARQILAVHLRGDLVCAHDRLLGEADHDIRALTDVSLACIPQEAVLALAEAYPSISRALWRINLIEASIYREWLLNVGRRDARQRLSHFVCELVARQQAVGLCEGPDYSWPMTQEELGDALGLTAVHVNRTVKGLRLDGLMEMGQRYLKVSDWTGLQIAGDFTSAYLH